MPLHIIHIFYYTITFQKLQEKVLYVFCCFIQKYKKIVKLDIDFKIWDDYNVYVP